MKWLVLFSFSVFTFSIAGFYNAGHLLDQEFYAAANSLNLGGVALPGGSEFSSINPAHFRWGSTASLTLAMKQVSLILK